MTEPVDLAYFNNMYASGDDPWGLRTGWYERRKRALVLASLPRPRYGSAFEPGCAVGELTAELAPRCGQLLAADLHPDAVRAARSRVSGLANADIQQLILPDEWPAARFELIILSELGYYFTPHAWEKTCSLVVRSLEPGGNVVACHWRHDFSERAQATEVVHARLTQSIGHEPVTTISDRDFLIDVWSAPDVRGSPDVPAPWPGRESPTARQPVTR